MSDRKMRTAHTNSINGGYLEKMRDQLALFQEGRGISRGEYSFVTLMAAIVGMLGQAFHSLITLLLALTPILEVSLHLLRFALETIIDIKNTQNPRELAKKVVIFTAELGLALSFMIFTFGSILYPMFCIGLNVGSRTLSFMAGKWIFF
ncbi:uncharacterized protein LOC106668300 [Cimex lectularius]|uniref:Uncharacterized protein n=1 Tax=Cimex lectularius TaxID=79782 RepID=A0A8I6TIM2_CIMLE|nr:uncharacterized protein LOC106668300 [Cimex lectularius]